MEKKIDISEILKYYPKGTKLYSPLCGECEFHRVYHRNGEICIEIRTNKEVIFCDKYGYYFYGINGEVIIFPSKENRDWSKFKRSFKDGDIVVGKNCACDYIAIFKEFIDGTSFSHHTCLTNFGKFIIDNISDNANLRFATKEEKEKLFDAIKAKGYRWNEENKILEKLVKPNFKAGDEIEKYGYKYTITEIKDNYYLTKCGNKIPIDCQDGFSLVPNKFDITTLKPFDKVLVRLNNSYWRIQFFERINKTNKNYPFVCMNGHNYKQCIPYEGNEHLLYTAKDCDEFYKI